MKTVPGAPVVRGCRVPKSYEKVVIVKESSGLTVRKYLPSLRTALLVGPLGRVPCAATRRRPQNSGLTPRNETGPSSMARTVARPVRTSKEPSKFKSPVSCCRPRRPTTAHSTVLAPGIAERGPATWLRSWTVPIRSIIAPVLVQAMIWSRVVAAEMGRECSSLHLCPPRPARVCFCKLQPGHLASLRDRAGCPAGS